MNVRGVLTHLASECGELTQAAIKLYQYGPKSTDLSTPPKSNQAAIEEEAGDVLALIHVLMDSGVIRERKMLKRITVKHKFYTEKYS